MEVVEKQQQVIKMIFNYKTLEEQGYKSVMSIMDTDT